MKALFPLVILLAAVLAAGCELIATSDNSQVVISDGNVSSLHTQQGNVIIDLNPGRQNRTLAP